LNDNPGMFNKLTNTTLFTGNYYDQR